MKPGKKLTRFFYTRSALTVAKEILGKYLVRVWRGRKIIGKIVEVEAYSGRADKGSHAFGGKVTARNKIMYRQGGHVYIYFIYGMYWLFNITTGKPDHPAAILVRAVEPVQGFSGREASGPGKFCKVFKLDKSFYGEDLTKSKKIWLEDNPEKIKVKKGPRIGIDYAGPYWAKIPWRFWAKDNNYISK